MKRAPRRLPLPLGLPRVLRAVRGQAYSAVAVESVSRAAGARVQRRRTGKEDGHAVAVLQK